MIVDSIPRSKMQHPFAANGRSTRPNWTCPHCRLSPIIVMTKHLRKGDKDFLSHYWSVTRFWWFSVIATVATIFAAKCNWTVNSSQSNLSQLYSSPKGRETKTLPLFGPWPDSAGFIKLFAGHESRGAAWGLKVLETASPPFCYSLWRSTNTQLYISKYTYTKVQIQLQAHKYNYSSTQIHREQQLKVFVTATLVCGSATVAATPGFCDSRSDGRKTADEVETLAKSCKSCCRYFCFFSPSPGYKVFNNGYIL